ncbi:MAG: hypothetical protein IT376_05230 [Polyangiaceae bacterium]|nr:hypothetical protein [Polyangiaceae bacterium]
MSRGLRGTIGAAVLIAVACGGGAGGGGAGPGDAGGDAGAAAGGAGAVAGAAGAGGSSGSAATGGGSGAGGAGGGGGGGASGAGGAASCLASELLAYLGRPHVMVGLSGDDASARAAPFDLRYVYLAGAFPDGGQPCASCATGCTSGGTSCANSGPGCAWWGCWQWDQDPPGAYARDFFSKVEADGQIPMITWYTLLHASGVGEGQPEVAVANDVAFMTAYFAQWRFLLEQVGSTKALLHLEPDFWGYAQHAGGDPAAIPAAVASANPTDCGALPNTFAGLGRCLIRMARVHAPSARVGLHGSGWGTGVDVLQNDSASLDVAGEARKLADFLVALGAAEGDFLVVDPSDRDAAWYEAQGQDRWWDATGQSLPDFDQALGWAAALAERARLPILWWQVPVGNASLPNQPNQWQDNRVDWFFAHLPEVAAAHGIGVAYGAGQGDQTTPETDGGNLIAKATAYQASGRTPACP